MTRSMRIDVTAHGAVGDGGRSTVHTTEQRFRDLRAQYEAHFDMSLRVTGNTVSADWFGLQSAILHAEARGARHCTVVVPGRDAAGRPRVYGLSHTVMVGVSGLHLRGENGPTLAVDLPYDALAGDRFSALHAQIGGGTSPRQRIDDLCLEGLTVHYPQAGPIDAAGIQLFRCVGFRIVRCTVVGDGEGMGWDPTLRAIPALGQPERPADPLALAEPPVAPVVAIATPTPRPFGSATSGFAVAHGESCGLIRDCTVRGVSKPGYYISAGHDITLERCRATGNRSLDFDYRVRAGEAPRQKNLVGHAPGFSIANARRVRLLECHAEGNDGDGVLVSSTGFWWEKAFERTDAAVDAVADLATALSGADEARRVSIRWRLWVGLAAMLSQPRHRPGWWTERSAQPWPYPFSTAGETYAARCRVEGLDGRLRVIGPDETAWYIDWDVDGQRLTLRVMFALADDVAIVGGTFCDNARHGIEVTCGEPRGRGRTRAVSVHGAAVTGSGSVGLVATATRGLSVTDCRLSGNQTGLRLDDAVRADGQPGLSAVRVDHCDITGNRNESVWLRSPEAVRLTDCAIDQAIEMRDMTGRPLRGLVLGEMDAARPAVEAPPKPLPFDTGRFVLRGVGAPTTPAPAGSTYHDTASGLIWTHTGGRWAPPTP